MPQKNIVICADGTDNSFGANVSNVSRLVRLLDLQNPEEQRVFYDQGVGTNQRYVEAAKAFSHDTRRKGLCILPEPKTPWLMPKLLTRWLGLGAGYGLYENVEEMYVALARCYSDGDRIYLFGFSRGAFTVRVLAGLIHRCGLLRAGQEHHFSQAYELYKKHYEHMSKARLKELKENVTKFRRDRDVWDCRISFLGLWDTVKSYGLFWPRSLPHLRHNSSVITVRHALAIDERRAHFQATSWGGVDDPRYNDVRCADSKDVREVWFAGCHSDVGGGYDRADDGLARASLTWMLQEAQKEERPLRTSTDDRQQVMSEFASGFDVTNSRTIGWRLVERLLPRFELENLPIPGVRRFKWGPSGRRIAARFARDGKVYVHSSARAASGSLGVVVDENQVVESVGDVTTCEAL